MQINITVSGDRAIAFRFGKISASIHARLLATVRSLTNRLLANIKAAEPKLSGRLESRTRAYFIDRDDLIRGVVRPGASFQDKLKAMALEFGAHGSALVHSYTRGNDVLVRAYHRHVNIAEHDFLRGPFAAMRSEIETEIRAAFFGAAEEA